MPDPRLARLRDLIAKLERSPDSEKRTWMLTETRSRLADLQTGATTAPMRPFENDVPEPSPAALRPRAPRARATTQVKRSTNLPGVTPQPVKRPPPGPRPDFNVPRKGDDDVLWNDPPDDEPEDGEPQAWKRGLRG